MPMMNYIKLRLGPTCIPPVNFCKYFEQNKSSTCIAPQFPEMQRHFDDWGLNSTLCLNCSTSARRGAGDIQCESKKVAPPKTFCDIFTCGEPVQLKINVAIAQTYSCIYTNFGLFISIFVWIVSFLLVRPLKF